LFDKAPGVGLDIGSQKTNWPGLKLEKAILSWYGLEA
jgi:hypothetical protein